MAGAIAALGAVVFLACPAGVVVEDHSGFRSFRFEQESGLGFCPETDSVSRATIERELDGELVFSAALFESMPATAVGPADPETPDPDCLDGIGVEGDCWSEARLAPRRLSPAEVEQVGSAFAGLRVHPRPDRRCQKLAVDPCRIWSFRWDDERRTDFLCGSDRLPDDQAAALVALLDALAARSAGTFRPRPESPDAP